MNDRLTRDDIEVLATRAAEEAVAKTFAFLGVNVKDPQAVMKLRRDLDALADWNDTRTFLRKKGWVAVLTTLISGLFALAVLGAASFFSTHH